MKKSILGLMVCMAVTAWADRRVIDLTGLWQFQFEGEAVQAVTVPHTWNAEDARDGNPQNLKTSPTGGSSAEALTYKRGSGTYTRILPARLPGKRLFLHCEGASQFAEVTVNGEKAGEHTGAFTAFCFEITHLLKTNGENLLQIRVDNTYNLDRLPVDADFSIFGGLYRKISLLETDPVCISPVFHASPGVLITPTVDEKDEGRVEMEVFLSRPEGEKAPVNLSWTIRTPEGKTLLFRHDAPVTEDRIKVSASLGTVTRWDSVRDPALYSATVHIASGEMRDEVTQRFGFRTFSIDPEKGFVLNGRALQIRGVNRHQDKEGKGWAISPEDEAEDMAIIREMGADGLRLAHYPQSPHIFDLADEIGFLVWSEASAVGKVTFSEAYRQNYLTECREMVYQHYNHPSVVFWGLWNELRNGAQPQALALLEEGRDLIRSLDPSRIIVAASNRGERSLNTVSPHIAFNLYPGWYGSGSMAASLKPRLNTYGKTGLALSEYGYGASIYHHESPPKQPKAAGYWHPEEYQTLGHLRAYRDIRSLPAVWGSFIWNMFDFGADSRREGHQNGMNDKGLVTYDRKTRKDAFYFYKANWTSEPMVHICSRRFTERKQPTVTVEAFCNAGEAILIVNGESLPFAPQQPDELACVKWENVELKSGENVITVKAGGCSDSVTWVYTKTHPTPETDRYDAWKPPVAARP